MSIGRSRWERLARDPYYAVLNSPEHRGDGHESRDEFFRSGESHVTWVLHAIAAYIDPEFAPSTVLDFGCGVGRLTIPLATHATRVVGVDISSRMLAEARRNCDARRITNVELVRFDDFMSRDSHIGSESMDFVHTFIVLQHVRPRIGRQIIDRLLGALRPGGVGAIHFTYARRASRVRKVVNRLRGKVPGLNLALNVMQHRPLLEPHMPMYQYRVDKILKMLDARGCSTVHTLLTDHGGHLGAMMLFQVP